MKNEKYKATVKHFYTRAFARVLDYLLFYAGIALGIFISPFMVPDLVYVILALFIPLFFIPFETLYLKLFGTTPGKALLGIHLRNENDEKPTLKQAFKRSFRIAAQGLGFGIPFVNLVCLYFYFKKLRKQESESLTIYISVKRRLRNILASLLFIFVALPAGVPSVQDRFFDTQAPLFSDMVREGKFHLLDDNIRWKKFNAPQGDFSISFPKQPKEESRKLPIPNSKNTLPYTEYKCTHASSGTHYSISYTTLPSKWLKYSSSLVLKGSLRFINKHVGHSEVISKRVQKFKSLPALDYVLFDGKVEKRGKLILLGNTLYKIEVTYDPSQKESLERTFTAFLNSFQPS